MVLWNYQTMWYGISTTDKDFLLPPLLSSTNNSQWFSEIWRFTLTTRVVDLIFKANWNITFGLFFLYKNRQSYDTRNSHPFYTCFFFILIQTRDCSYPSFWRLSLAVRLYCQLLSWISFENYERFLIWRCNSFELFLYLKGYRGTFLVLVVIHYLCQFVTSSVGSEWIRTFYIVFDRAKKFLADHKGLRN